MNSGVTNNNMAFIDTFPAGVVYQSTVSNAGCGGGPVFQDQASGALAAGDLGIRVSNIDMAANTTCTIVINVSSATPGSYSNTSANFSGFAGALNATSVAGVNDTLNVRGTTLTKAFDPRPRS